MVPGYKSKNPETVNKLFAYGYKMAQGQDIWQKIPPKL